MIKVIVLFLAVQLASQSIFLVVKPKLPRCMVEYTAGQGSTASMKIKIVFPKIADLISH